MDESPGTVKVMMDARFPELTSFGTLVKFAVALENVAAELSTRASEQSEPHRDRLSAQARQHAQRGRQLERLRQERLNEVVLQPISGMNRADYVPPLHLPADASEAIATVCAAEDAAARFYEDAAAIAVNVIPGLDKTLRKLAGESRKFAVALAPAP